MSTRILLAGGSGMIGSALYEELSQSKYQLRILTRNRKKADQKTFYHWNPAKSEIDESALDVDWVVNLAGAGIADKRWTQKRKKEIIESRVKSTSFLYDSFVQRGSKIDGYIGASAIGYYGSRGKELLDERATAQNDSFLSQVCVLWEDEHKKFEHISSHFSIARIGIVLGNSGGAFPKMIMTNKAGISSYFGTGAQVYSWIHINDMVGVLKFLLENKSSGIYNGTAPSPATNKQIAEVIQKEYPAPSLLVPAPAFGLKLALGEMSTTVLNSTRVSAQKLLEAGYEFKFSEIELAIKDLLKE